MSDESRGEPVVSLERPVHIRRSWLRRLLRLAVVCLGVVIAAAVSDVGLLDRGRECDAAVHGQQRDAVAVCERAYDDNEDPVIGVLLAKAYYGDGNRAAAARLASQLISTPQRSDALQILGQVRRDEGRNDDAMKALEQARQLHHLQHRPRELAGDAGLLALIRAERNEFAEALQLVDECIAQAKLARDVPRLGYCHIAAAKTLIRVGFWRAAEEEAESANSLVSSGVSRADLQYQLGSLHQERREYSRARAYFEMALRYYAKTPLIEKTVNTELNLAYSFAKDRSLATEHRLRDAQHYLDEAMLHDPDHEKELERMWVAAEIAYQRQELVTAASLIEKYFQRRGADQSTDRDDQIDAATLAAQIALDRHDLEGARRWAQRGVDQVEHVRGAQSLLELRPWALAKRRAPYELLFVALAASDQAAAGAMVFDQWQGRTVQDALVRPQPPASLDYKGMADQITQLGTWLHAASKAPFARNPDPGVVLRTMHQVDLVALIVANGDVWRLTANHGSPRLKRLGMLDEVKELISQFLGHPTDVRAASDLAARLLPNEIFQSTRESLHVLIDGQLPALPVAALRRGGIPLVAMRPVVHMLRLPEIRCVHVTRSGHATVLANLGGKLSKTQEEAERVAALLHASSEIGDRATKAALRSAAYDSVLHIATHAKIENDGAALAMADGWMSALEISASRIAPSLAVLSACSTALSDGLDFELAGSMTAGFLGAGSQHVVATLGDIADDGAPAITTRFYQAGGVADPARALAVVQSELAKTSNVDWPYFAVFGPDVCPEDAPGQR